MSRSTLTATGKNFMDRFYDDIAELYHLVHEDLDRSIAREGKILESLIEERWPGSRSVLDATCGIGTQALGLAARTGFEVTASDLSRGAIDRARREAAERGLTVDLSVCDVRELREHHEGLFDVVLAMDNALPHLLTDEEILRALRQMLACTKPGGGCILSMRDYDREARGRGLMHVFGPREVDGQRWFVFQVWDFDPPTESSPDHVPAAECYDFSMYFVPETAPEQTRTSKSRYYAISPTRMMQLMGEAGFERVARVDELYFQPLLLGNRGSAGS